MEISRLKELSALNYLSQKILDENVEVYSRSIVEKVCERYFNGQIDLDKISTAIYNDVNCHHFVPERLKDVLISCLNTASIKFFEDGVISEEEEVMFADFLTEFDINLGDLPPKYIDSNIYRVVQLIFLKDLQKGEKPNFIIDDAPIVLTKGEFFVWLYRDITAYEEKTRSQWVGGSSGVSVRICKGVYYRMGQSKGQKVSTQYLDEIGRGVLVLTNKNMVFYSPMRSVKIPYKNIVALIPYSDGLEIQRQTNQKRLVLTGLDSWFIMNLLSTIEI